jgi:uncharacterized protein
MKIAIVGVTGKVGKRILAEALRRGHEVTGIARNASNLTAQRGLTLLNGDANAPGALAPLLAGNAAVVSALRFQLSDPAQLIGAVRESGVIRYLVVGGAGSLEIAAGELLADAPNFPEAYLAESSAGKAFLDALREINDLDWTMLSPSALFVPGERTGKFRLGNDRLLSDAAGKSSISFEDFAVALLDEIEKPSHVRQRFTVGY